MPYIKGTTNGEKLIGTVGADEIYAFEGNDIIDGREGFNTIWAGDGNDIIKAGKGRDLIYGEAGDDLIQIKGNYSGTYIVGGYGGDSISLDRAASGTLLSLDYDFQYDAANVDPLDFIEVTIRNDSMSIDKTDSSSDVFRDSVDGLSKLGPDGTIVLFGTRGDDTVDTNRTEGPMISFFAQGEDTFDGGADTYEKITFAQSYRYYETYEIRGYNEITITNSSSGQMSGRVVMTEADFANQSTDSYTTRFTDMDLIEGSVGDDLFTGSTGDDSFRPGFGNDGFNGGRGSDTVYYDASGVTGVVVDLQYRYAEATFLADSLYDNYGPFYGSANDRFVFEDQVQYDGLRNVENAVGSDYDDILRGNNKGNTLNGGMGSDNLNGRKGNDTLVGGDGDDNLRGFQGKDKFVFDSMDGNDRIFKWEDGSDKFVITDGLSFSDVEISDKGRHTLITFGDTEVTVLHTDHTDFTASDFLFA